MRLLKLLVVIANYGVRNDQYLKTVIAEYRALPHDVYIVILASEHKSVEGADAVVVHKPVGNPWTFPFAHRAILADRVDHFDLFIYSEDDTLITGQNIDAFLVATDALNDGEIAGFLRTEQSSAGETSVSTISGHFHWDPNSVVQRGRHLFAYFSNEHAACYILTRRHLRRAIETGGFLVPPHEDKYDLLVTAATDPYTQCGFRKLVCVSRLEAFLVAHLPNKYVGRFGLDLPEVFRQVSAMAQIHSGGRPATTLLGTETRLPRQRWSKNYYDPPRPDVLAAVPRRARTFLSYGCGRGTLEPALAARGARVTAAPLDSIIGACVEAPNINVIYGDSNSIWRKLARVKFDCILALDLLHLVPDPPGLLARMREQLNPEGAIVASIPNVMQIRTVWKRMNSDPAFSALGDYAHAGLHPASYWSIRKWFADARLDARLMSAAEPDCPRRWYRVAARLFPPGFAGHFVFQASSS